MIVNLNRFNPKKGLDRGRSFIIETIWYIFKVLFFLSPIPWPTLIKKFILITFGAKVGDGFVLKPRVNIHFPWKLKIGDNVWIGEEVFILNFETVILESNSCISQRAFLCGGNHDYSDPAFSYRNGPIVLKKGVWVGAQSFVGPNVTLNENCVISACSFVTETMPKNKVCGGNPCKVLKDRWGSQL